MRARSEAELAAAWDHRTGRGRMPSITIDGQSTARFELRDGKIVRVQEGSA